MSSNDTDEEQLMHSKNNNIEVKINDKADAVIKDFFDCFFLDSKSDYKQQLKAAVSL